MEAVDKATVFLCVMMLSYAIPPTKGAELDQSLRTSAVDKNPPHEDVASKGEIPTTLSTLSDSTPPCRLRKHEEFCKCSKQGLVTYERDEYVMQNGTVFVPRLNKSYSSLFYEMDGDSLLICTPPHMKSDLDKKSHQHYLAHVYITKIGLSISIVCLSLHLIAFVLVPDLRNIPGYYLAFLCVSLLSGFISFLVGHDEYIQHFRGPCVAAAFSTHFFLFSSLLWMNIMAFDVLKSLLNAARKFRVISSKITFKNFYVYCIYAWGTALGFAIAAVISDNSPNFPDQYKPQFGKGPCWFQQGKSLLVFFAAPVFTLICMNVVFFGFSTYVITKNTMEADDTQQSMKRNLIMYSRLAVINGLSWVSGLLAGLLNWVVLWYVFSLLNTLQGLFIFLAFTFTPKVKRHFSQIFGFDSRKYPVQTCSHENFSESVNKGSDLRTTEGI